MYGNPAGDIGHQGSRYHADSCRSVYSCRYSYDYRSNEKMDEFNQAFADVSVKTVEYVNGMKELKIFAADESTYSRLSESIRTYSTVVTEWFQSCLKYVAFNHADLNSNLVFLFPLAGLMYLSGSVTAASYIMYLFMGLAMLIPLETVSNNFDYIGMNASVAKR